MRPRKRNIVAKASVSPAQIRAKWEQVAPRLKLDNDLYERLANAINSIDQSHLAPQVHLQAFEGIDKLGDGLLRHLNKLLVPFEVGLKGWAEAPPMSVADRFMLPNVEDLRTLRQSLIATAPLFKRIAAVTKSRGAAIELQEAAWVFVESAIDEMGKRSRSFRNGKWLARRTQKSSAVKLAAEMAKWLGCEYATPVTVAAALKPSKVNAK
jgi:hypothetical protein